VIGNLLSRSRLSSLGAAAGNAAGQAIWAAGQMAVLIFLSHRGMQHLIGVYAFAIGVFAVATLVLGLNLRVAISTDRDKAIGYSAALRARSIACAVALPLAVVAMAATGATSAELAAATLLVAGRVPDQLSDVVIGFYLRDNRQRQIGRSFLLRGAAAIGAVAVAWVLSWSVLTMASVTLLSTSVAALAHDLLPGSSRYREEGGNALAVVVRSTWAISPYPALDALHVNSLRFTLVATTGPAFYGLVAIAQLLYAPFQILMNAFGFGYLRSARRVHESGDQRLLRRHILLGLVLGSAIGGGFVLTCLLLPEIVARLLFADMAAEAAGPLRVAAVALGLAPLCGFLSQCIVTGTDRRTYLSAPIAGIVLVWAGTLFVLFSGGKSGDGNYSEAMMIALFFAASFLLRVLLSLGALQRIVRGGKNAEAT